MAWSFECHLTYKNANRLSKAEVATSALLGITRVRMWYVHVGTFVPKLIEQNTCVESPSVWERHHLLSLKSGDDRQ